MAIHAEFEINVNRRHPVTLNVITLNQHCAKAIPMATNNKLPTAGSAYAFRLENGMYGACRVLRFCKQKSHDDTSCDAVLVACSDWISDSVPDPCECDLRPIMRLSHHRWDKDCVNWCTSSVPNSFIDIGIVLPSDFELNMQCNSTVRWEYYPIQRLSQWEWDTARKSH